MSTNFDLIVVGAGPTGLFSAVLARQLGLTVCVIEKRPGPLDLGRADALNARTQQVLDVAGVLKDLRPFGLQCNTSSIFKDGEFQSRNNRWWTSLKNTAYKEFLMIGQSDVEKALVKNLDVDVLYDTEVESFSETSTGASVVIKGKTLTAKYVIGADGGQSPIRKGLNIDFVGDKPNMCWAVLDTFIKTDFPLCDEIISFEENGQSRVSWIPRERGMARFYILLDGEVTQERSEESIRSHMKPYNVEFVKTEWFSTYNVQERVAETFLSPLGRIVLAGDASHIHAVNGGQGLNTGIADAFALTWRLYFAIKTQTATGPALPHVLTSYDAERRITAASVVNVASKLVRSTLKTAQEYVELVEASANNITGMGITYAPNVPTVIEGTVGDFVAGARSPDIDFVKAGVVKLRLYELLKYGDFVVIKSPEIKFDTYSAPSWLSGKLQVWNIEKHGDGWAVTTESGARLITNAPFAENSAVVIRPDMYTGFAGQDPSVYFQQYLV
ncbi:hypothetical protein HYFRA_00006403 [Hymenoscyphus fraxineus]|uniref:FAD-binding domain-containing protein n=1 Tax=Hymenoscyphus fraxineus TaxID=746836 RepID=A0A9N9PLD7_9HELO|nr:hypothetical protein HYFRA_00006403 [Hymenoscyphus fraxineus]